MFNVTILTLDDYLFDKGQPNGRLNNRRFWKKSLNDFCVQHVVID